MKYPTTRFVFDRKKVATKKTKGLVQIEVYSERTRKLIGTNVKVYKDQWDDRKKVVNCVDSVNFNNMLDSQKQAIDEFIAGLIEQRLPFSFEKLDRFLEDSSRSKSFIAFLEERVNNRTDIRESTRKQHRSFIATLKDFKRIVYMDDLTKQNILLYDDYLGSMGLSKATKYNHHKRMKVYLGIALKLELIDKNPYDGLKFERGKFDSRKYLTDAELKRIVDCEISSPHINKIRDLFLFQCYTGLAYADLAKFDFANDVIVRDNRYIVADKRKKTNENYYIVLLPPAMDILRRYEYRLPILSNQKYNESLKVLAHYAKIDKEITTHVGRHTFAVWALNNGVRIEVVSKMLGHSNIKTTQIYAKLLNKEVEQGFDILEKSLK